MSIKLKPTYETEVFVNEPGYLTIKQQDNLGNEPAIIMLSPEQARLVIVEAARLLRFENQWWTAAEDTENELEPVE
jgi:hypothetical protein